jgi:hypothetical protein
MFGLDEAIASYSDGATLALVAAVAVVLGLRHATDPDHIAAVSTLVASRRGTRAGALLGAAWGAGHAVTLFAFGVPIVLYRAFLPERVQQGAEAFIGLVIVGLATWLLVRWRTGRLADAGRHAGRTPISAFGVGLAHGIGGSAGVGILIVASVDSRSYAIAALALLAALTAVSMMMLSSGLGRALSTGPVTRTLHSGVPALGVASLAFGTWYVLAALSLAPYYF